MPKHDPAGRGGGNSRNGHWAKTVLADVGPVQIDLPRDTISAITDRVLDGLAERQSRRSGRIWQLSGKHGQARSARSKCPQGNPELTLHGQMEVVAAGTRYRVGTQPQAGCLYSC
jgi:hypothetical protein